MTITFTPDSTLQNDQTAGLQTTDGDTDITYDSTPLLDALKARIAILYPGADVAFADDTLAEPGAGAARQTSVMTVSTDGTLAADSVRFTDSGGGTLDGDDSGLTTVDGYAITLIEDPTDPTIVYGEYIDVADSNTVKIAFAIQMEVTYLPDGQTATVNLNMITYVAIDHPINPDADDSLNLGDNLHIGATDISGAFDFSVLASNKFLYGVVGGTGGAFLVIGKDPQINDDGTPVNGGGAGDFINSSQGGGGTTIGVNNQHFTGNNNIDNVEQGAYFTYVTGMAAGVFDNATGISLQPP